MEEADPNAETVGALLLTGHRAIMEERGREQEQERVAAMAAAAAAGVGGKREWGGATCSHY